MKHATIKEYILAIDENIEASKLEIEAKSRKNKAHYRLISARDALRAMERELLEDTLILN